MGDDFGEFDDMVKGSSSYPPPPVRVPPKLPRVEGRDAPMAAENNDTWAVNVITLTDAQVDLIKLALLDAATTVAAGFQNNTYYTYDPSCFGCTFNARITYQTFTVAERRLDEIVFSEVKSALENRGVTYLSLIVRPQSMNVETRTTIGIGNVKRDGQQHNTGSVYRSKPF